jgi:hypothetical protein
MTRTRLAQFRVLVAEIQRDWTRLTAIPLFPKLHMLSHCVLFAEQHACLGQVSEAALESCHARCNPIIHLAGRNLGRNTNERLRRALADVATQELQPLLNRSQKYQHPLL